MSYFKRLRKLLKLHFNLPKTLYFNFKVFGIKDALKLPVFLFGSIHLEGLYRGCVELQKIKTGGVYIGGGWFTELSGYSNRFKSFLRVKGKLILGNNIVMAQGIVLSVSKNAVLRIGNNVRINAVLWTNCRAASAADTGVSDEVSFRFLLGIAKSERSPFDRFL